MRTITKYHWVISLVLVALIWLVMNQYCTTLQYWTALSAITVGHWLLTKIDQKQLARARRWRVIEKRY